MILQTDPPISGAPASPVRAFLVQAVFWNLALFSFIRLAWIDQHLVGALVEFQKAVVFWYGTAPDPRIVVNSSCSGADVMALCAGVTLAYPVAWSRRLLGAAIGMVLILTLNAVRIASLYAVASSPATLDLLHVYVWPAILSVVTVLYVFAWIRASERGTIEFNQRWKRFGLIALGTLVLYAAAVPWVFTSSLVREVGVWTASAGGALLSSAGATVRTNGNILMTDRGAFQVTQECLFTPMLPLYFAALFSFPVRRRVLWLLAALPLFFALGVARLLLLALPPVVAESPIVLAHGFYQLVAGGVAIVVAAHVAERATTWQRPTLRTLAGLAIAVVAGMAAAAVWEPMLLLAAQLLRTVVPSTIAAIADGDRQGALALLPGFQVGLVAGLWWALTNPHRPRVLAVALCILAMSQIVLLMGLGTFSSWQGVEPHALVIRAWALAVPLAIAFFVFTAGGTAVGDPSYSRFWHDVGEEFPTLTGAASTTYYFENEKRLISEAMPSLSGITLLKTDLWDEAKNTRIMQWAADQGARVYGIDLSEPIVRQARAAFEHRPLRPVVSDVRRLPFGDASFDAIYSMGTIEHFEETEATVVELARILKPGGRLILGVPNRHDPFLRPLMVVLLHRIGLYGYGYEKSYSRRSLRSMLEAADLQVTMESGILFVPGWIRMFDLWCHTRARSLAVISRALLTPFVWIDRHVPGARRHGYLLASVGLKPEAKGPRPDGSALTAELSWQLPKTEGVAEAGAQTGVEYVVDARGCDTDALRSLPHLQRIFSDVLGDLSLRPVAPPVWHVFPGEGGVTGMVLLAESHLTIHTYPELGVAAINLYCCRPSAEWPWSTRLPTLIGARGVTVRTLRRG
jgi:S-adenosylmethionine decarboxylase